MKIINLKAALLAASLALGLSALSAKALTTVVSADPHGNPNAVYVVYSANMDPTSSTATGNYTLSNTFTSALIPISSATLAPDLVTVQLNLGSSLQLTNNYTLTIANVKDASLNFISPNPTLANFYFGGPPGGISFTFNDGLVPANTTLAIAPPLTDVINVQQAVASAGGFENSGCLVLISNATGQTFGQWQITNDLANGSAVSSFAVSFKLWNVNQDPGSALGNGLIFHVGPRLPSQYTGGASSWGNGLDLNFRNFANGIIPLGVNIWWYPPYSEPFPPAWQNQAGGGTIPSVVPLPAGLVNLTTNWTGYADTNGVAGGFSNYVNVSFSVSNGVANLICSSAQIGNVVLFSNATIPTWTPITGGPGQPAIFAFTSTDGSGNHQQVVIDDVDLTVNGIHVAGGTTTPVGPVGFTLQPASLTTNENVYVTYTVGVDGAPPYYYQWYSNTVAIAGATNFSYTTPLTMWSGLHTNALGYDTNTYYSVVVSNNFSSAVSSNAILTIIRDTNGVQVLSVGSVDGNSIGVLFSGYVDAATAGNAANYRINGGAVSVISATVRTNIANFGDPVYNYIPSYLTTVTLTNGTPVSGSYTVTVSVGNSVHTKSSFGAVAQTNLTGTVVGMTDVDLGTPGAAGQAFSGASNLMEIVASGSDIMAIAPSGTSDQGNYAYLLRTGNFDMVANLTWETPTANGAKAGMMVRPSPNGSSDASSPAISEIVFPAAPNRNTYETAMRTSESSACVSWAASGAPTSGHAGAYWTGSPSGGNNWIRIRRVGPYFNGYASPNGSIWTLIGSVTADTNTFPPAEFVGLVASAGNNDGRYNEADFQGFGPLAFSGATVTLPINLQANYVVPQNAPYPLAIGAQVSGGIALQSDIVYQWQRAESNNPTVFNNIADGTGNTNLYITPVLTIAQDNGAKYRCIAFVGDITTGHSVTSVVANLTVIIDTNPPSMTGASADDTFTQAWINFNKGMSQGSLQNTANYKLTFGSTNISICGAVATANSLGLYTNVVLTLCSPLTSSIGYTLSLTNLLDLAGNNINSNPAVSNRSRTVTGWALVQGYLKYERWFGPLYPSGIGTYNSDLTNFVGNANYYNNSGSTPATAFNPVSPNLVELITYSGYPSGDIGNVTVDLFDFSARISGYVIPPANGSYNFYVRGNDGTALLVSPDSSRVDEVFVGDANVGYTAPGPTWNFCIVNNSDLGFLIGFKDSSAISMTSGGLYYVEALEQQGNGSSWLEFTWGIPNPVGFDGGVLTNMDYAAQTDVNTLTNTAGGAYAPGRVAGATTAPGNGGAPTNAWNITGTNIAIYVDPDISGITATGLTNTTVLAGNSVTLSVNASAVLNLGTVSASQPVTVPANNIVYQWYSNNVALAGATNASYTTPVFASYTPPNTNFNYSVTITAASPVQTISWMAITNSAIVTELPNPPSVASASSFGGNTIGIQYNKAMDPNTATNAAHYSIIGCATTVTGVRMMPDGKTVLLTLSANLCDGAFTVAITNVQDTAGNTIAANTTASGNVLYPQLTAADIGVATSTSVSEPLVVQTNSTLTNVTFDLNFPGAAVMVTNGVFEVMASGRDIGNNQDGQYFIYEQRSGDFDIKVRVDGLTAANNASKAGLMLRENLTPGSRLYNIVADPPKTETAADGSGLGLNKVEVSMRTAANGASANWGNNPAPANLGTGSSATQVPGLWLRLKLVGRKFYAYTGADGTNWALAARENLASNWPLTNFYVGICVSARTNSLYANARLSNYGDYVMPTNKRALFLIGDEMNVPAGAPNATPVNTGVATPQQASDTRVWNTLIAMGYNVTATRNETFQPEDAEGMSVVLWSSTGNSGGTGNPSSLTTLPVPLMVWESSAWGKLKMASADGGNTPSTRTTINITNTAAPTASVLSLGLSGATTVFATADINSRAAKSTLGAGVVVVAGQSDDPGQAVFWAYEKGAAMTGTSIAPHRRVSMFVNDTGAANLNTTGFQLFTNAIQWTAAAQTEAPTILTPPASQAVAVGSPVTFVVTALGPGPYSYQWTKIITGSSTNDIGGATNRDYTILATTLGDSGTSYFVRVTGINSGLSVTSSPPATLTVQTPIAITSQPQSVTNATGTTATFSVTATGTSPAYQWYSNNVAIAGATSNPYTTPTLTISYSNSVYKVVVTNLISSVTSSNAVLTVISGGTAGFSSITSAGGQVTLTWTNGTALLSSTNLLLPMASWTVVPGATSPYTVPATNAQQFFRVQQ
jgi:hypothetical protein